MKRVPMLLTVFMLVLTPAVLLASSVPQVLPFSVKVSLPTPVTYIFRFSLWDAPVGGIQSWSQEKSILVKTSTVSTVLGQNEPPPGLSADIFTRQQYVQTEYKTKPSAAFKKIGARVKLNVVPYAMWSATTQDVSSFNADFIQMRVQGSCDAGSAIRQIDTGGLVVCEPVVGGAGGGDITGVAAVDGLTGGGTSGDVSLGIASGGVTGDMIANGTVAAADVNTAEVQARVSGTCAPGSSIASVAANGTVTCEADDNSGGTITGVTAGNGLTGGGTSGAATLNVGPGTGITVAADTVAVDTAVVPRKSVANTFTTTQTVQTGADAAKGLVVKANSATQSANLLEVQNSAGAVVASVSPAGAFTGDGASLTGVQRQITGSCDAGNAIRVVAADGTVTCEPVSGGTGDITGIILGAGSGLTGGGTTGDVSLGIAAGGVTGAMIANATIAVADLADGAALGEIADDDGTGSGLDADLLDGQHAAAFAGSSHAHDASAVNAGTLGTDRYSAYADLGAEGYLGNAAGDVALNNGTLQATLFADQAQTAHGLSAGALLALDLRYVPAPAVGGSAWYTSTLGDLDRFNSITIGADGLPIIAAHVTEPFSGNSALHVLKCGDLSCSAAGRTLHSPPAPGSSDLPGVERVDIPPSFHFGLYNSIAIGADGLPVISYQDADDGELQVRHCDDAACASYTQTTIDGSVATPRGQYTSITVGTDGFPIISSCSNGALRVYHCGDAACTFADSLGGGVPCDAGNTSITIGADGLPIIAYGGIRVYHCNTAVCSTGGNRQAAQGAYPSIAIGSDGLPIISHYDLGKLLVYHCSDAWCTGGKDLTVDQGNVGEHSSITIGADGLPIISYYDATNADLKVARCGNVDCSEGNVIMVADSVGDVGQYSSITVGANGFPYVTYLSNPGSLPYASIKLAHTLFRPLGRR